MFDEVSKLFQRGEHRADLATIKSLLTACAEASELAPVASDVDGEELFQTLDRFLEYVDSHRLDPADIVAIREWEADTFDCRDDGKNGVTDALAVRIAKALRRVWISVNRGEGVYQPRHAILCEILSQPVISIPELSFRARTMDAVTRGEPVPEGYSEGEIEKFLRDPENKSLFQVVAHESELLYQSCTGAGHFEAADLVDALVKDRNEGVAFHRDLAAFIALSDRLLKAYPAYAIIERRMDIMRLRAAWNVVHAYGDEQAKALYTKYIKDLREYFAKRADRVTVKWLDQVMEKPGKPPEKFVVRLQLGEPEKPEAKEPKDTKKGQK